MQKLSDQIERKFTEILSTSEWEIQTDTGWESLISSNKTIPYQVFEIKLENGYSMKCADTHILFTDEMEEIFAIDLVPGVSIMTDEGPIKVSSIEDLGFESEMYDLSVDSENHRFYANGILSHNSTSTISYYLHMILFNEEKVIGILANKGATARELLSRLKLAYENLPFWMQVGVTSWNKGSIELGNGCKVLAASTSSSSIRGCVTGETKITIRNSELNNIETDSIESFAEKEKGFIECKNTEILTPDGFKSFTGFNVNYEKRILTVKTESFSIRVTEDHKFISKTGWKTAGSLRKGSFIKTENGFEKIIEKKLEILEEPILVYDPCYVDEENHGFAYLSNGIVSHNTSMYAILLDEFAFLHPNMAMDFFESTYPVISSGETTRINIVSTPNGMNHFYKMWQEAIEKRSQFVPIEIDWWEVPGRDEKWKAETIANIGEEAFEQEYGGSFLGSANTLFQTSVLRKLVHKNPIYTIGDLKIFDAPISEHQYVITSDTAEGIGGDYTTFIVHDVTEYPFKQVARYKSNTVSHLVFPDILYTSANQYNEAWVLVELNSTGRQVAEILQNDLEYENILFTSANSRKKEMLMLGSGNLPGVKTTKSTKRVGCNNIKQLVENNKYLIQDFDTLQEASTFVRYGNSFASEPGGHDDLMMCLVLFGWLNTQDFFGHLMDKNMRKDLYEALSQKINEEIPLGIMTARDLQEKRIVENGVVWEKVK